MLLELIILKLHGNIIPIQGSMTSHDDVQEAVNYITNVTGYIDLLVNNAGMTTFDSSPNARPMPVPGDSSISEISDYFFNYRPPEVWRDTLETNVGAVFTTSMAFLPLLDAGNKRRAKDLPKSQIVAIGSTGGLTRFTQSFIYNASKVGIIEQGCSIVDRRSVISYRLPCTT
jgi:NAD(P)-dependent dehydrogenase (short-subunit alcohol dehydrogenase family)